MFAVLEITVPVFFIVMIGFLFTRFHHMPVEIVGRVNLELFVPVLLIYVLSEKLPVLTEVGPLIAIAGIVVLGSGIIAWPLVRLIGLDVRVILPPVMFNNSGNLGLPMAVLAFGEQALPWAVTFFVVQIILQFTVGILILENRINPLVLLRNPVFMSTFIGISMYLFDLHIPTILMPGMKMISDVAIPLMLVILGGNLAHAGLQAWKIGLFGGLLTPASGVLAAVIGLQWIPLPELQQSAAILFGALPPAVMNVILAQKYKVDVASSASIVAIGNILAIFVLSMALYWVLPSA